MKIIFKLDGGGVAVMAPSEEALQFATIEQIAEKDVPFQVPYKIVQDVDIPTDRSLRSAWEWDNSIVPDGFGGENNEFDAELLAAYNALQSGGVV